MTELERKIRLGQRLAVGFDGPTIPEEYVRLVKEYKIGNAILFKRNVESYEQLRRLTGELRALIQGETGLEPFIMIDEECGSVSRLAHIAAPTPCAMAIGATDDPENAYRVGKIVGEELRAAGVNFNLAPVLDCYTNPDATVLGIRSFAREPEKVAKFGLRYIAGLQEAGVMACGKHFPGHGDTAVDSHLALPVVDKPMDEVRRTELVSFAAAIRGGVDAIMSAHVVFPAIEPERVPSTVSRRVMTGLLRQEMGFDGIIVSDGMEMQAVMNLFGIEEAVRRALAAGVDVALICHSAQQAASASRYLMEALRAGRLDEDETEAHFRRILARKEKLPPAAGGRDMFGNESQRSEARAILEKAVRILSAPGGKPLPDLGDGAIWLGQTARAASQAADYVPLDAAEICARALGGRRVSPGEATMAPEGAAAVILRGGDGAEEFIQTAAALAEAGKRVVAISMNTPRCLEKLPDTVWKIDAWQYDELAINALLRLLNGGESGNAAERNICS